MIDAGGMRFGRLTVIGYDGRDGRSENKWICVCDCGRLKTIVWTSLRTGRTRSCGCYDIEQKTKHNRTGDRTYRSWSAMRRRCLVKHDEHFPQYGARGIQICPEWSDFRVFLRDMGERPEGKSLERINTDGNYEPPNCIWATPKVQARNRRTTKLSALAASVIRERLLEGTKRSVLADEFGVSRRLIGNIANGDIWLP